MAGKPGTGGGGVLLDKLKARIVRDGPMTVADYMSVCLTDPDHGYYVTRDPLGARGDFITAPEISQVFGELIGAWAAFVWQQMGAPSPVRLVELGPGRGTLMSDLLRAAGTVPGFVEAANVHLVELSPALRAVQESTLAGAPCGITWHGGLADVPGGATILVANEFLDALPVRQFVLSDGLWRERCVTLSDDGTLGFAPQDARAQDLADIPDSIRIAARDGDIVEICPAYDDIAAALARRSNDAALAAVFIDYGHDRSAPGDTFQAVRGHDYFDPLCEPGTADLTAHVDFERLANLARSAGLGVHGPVSQGAFLMALGLKERTERLARGANEDQARQRVSGAQRLAEQDKMGQLFRVMALTSPGLVAPAFDRPA